MSIGHFKAFTDLVPGQWFATPGKAAVNIGFAISHAKEVRPVFVTKTSAKSVSPLGVQRIYVPEITEISIDTASLTESIDLIFGCIVISKGGSFLRFSYEDMVVFANTATGQVEDPGSQKLWFGRWSLLEKKPDGYKALLDFGS